MTNVITDEMSYNLITKVKNSHDRRECILIANINVND